MGESARRDFFKALGGGVLIVLTLTDAVAQQESGGRRRGGGGPRPGEIDAWLHIASDGTVTAYTGKVEVGQDIRTSLTRPLRDVESPWILGYDVFAQASAATMLPALLRRSTQLTGRHLKELLVKSG